METVNIPGCQTEPLSFWTFLRKCCSNVAALIVGVLSIPLTICAIYFPNVSLKILFAALAALSVVWACYRVWCESVDALRATIRTRDIEMQATIATRDAEIEKLKHRPYDEEHRRLAENKVGGLSEVSKDLVSFLLHYGETEANELLKKCRHEPEFNNAVQRARIEGLVQDIRTGNPAQCTERYSWKINPQFETVLQDLLGSRKTTYF